MAASIPIGIDLGTTNSAAARLDQHGVAELIPNDRGDTVTPSAVYIRAVGDVSVGKEAREASAFEPERVAQFFKREMGNLHYQPTFGGVSETAETLSAHVLRYLREQAERSVGELGDAVVTVPAYFHNAQREATIRAARSAGLNIARTINEPTAAAVAYGVSHPDMQGVVMVYDLGGGTFDVTILEYGSDCTQVIASDGNHDLGGGLWDDRLVNYVCDAFAQQEGDDPRDDPVTTGELRLRCEDAKCALSSRTEVRIPVSHAGRRSTVSVPRALFENLTADLLDQTRVLMIQALRAASLKWPDIGAVLLVGGSTRMPAVPEMLQLLTRKAPLRDINPDECVAAGAAIEATATGRPQFLMGSGLRKTQDVTPHSLGYVAISPDGSCFMNDIIIPRNTPSPVLLRHTAEVETSVHDNNNLDIYLLQGESRRVLDNTVLGRYAVTGIPHRGGKTRVSIGFAYDLSGVVKVDCIQDGANTQLPVQVVQEGVDLRWTDLTPDEWRQRNAAAVCLLFDTSGSMSGDGIREAKHAGHRFLEQCNEQIQVGLVEFGQSPGRVLCGLTLDRAKLKQAIDKLGADNGTPLTEGLAATQSQFPETQTQRIVVVLTDGMPNDPEGALCLADQLKADGIRIIAVGAGSSVNREFLRRLATNADDGMNVDFSQLTSTFGRIAQAVGGGAGLSVGRGGMIRLGQPG